MSKPGANLAYLYFLIEKMFQQRKGKKLDPMNWKNNE